MDERKKSTFKRIRFEDLNNFGTRIESQNSLSKGIESLTNRWFSNIGNGKCSVHQFPLIDTEIVKSAISSTVVYSPDFRV